jgi:hypothetical protein
VGPEARRLRAAPRLAAVLPSPWRTDRRTGSEPSPPQPRGVSLLLRRLPNRTLRGDGSRRCRPLRGALCRRRLTRSVSACIAAVPPCTHVPLAAGTGGGDGEGIRNSAGKSSHLEIGLERRTRGAAGSRRLLFRRRSTWQAARVAPLEAAGRYHRRPAGGWRGIGTHRARRNALRSASSVLRRELLFSTQRCAALDAHRACWLVGAPPGCCDPRGRGGGDHFSLQRSASERHAYVCRVRSATSSLLSVRLSTWTRALPALLTSDQVIGQKREVEGRPHGMAGDAPAAPVALSTVASPETQRRDRNRIPFADPDDRKGVAARTPYYG